MTSSRSKVVTAAVDEFVDVDVVDNIIRIVVGRQVGKHQLILVKVVHHRTVHHINQHYEMATHRKMPIHSCSN